jgi:hypothetical protein
MMATGLSSPHKESTCPRREMDAELARPVDAGRASIVVDLSGVSFIDSGKLRLYVMCSPREQIHPDASGPPRAATDRTEGPLQ